MAIILSDYFIEVGCGCYIIPDFRDIFSRDRLCSACVFVRDRRDLSSRQKASLARNSDISVDPYDRRAHDVACTASHDRHLRFIVANIRAAWPTIEISLSGAQISARGIVKLNLSIKVNRLKFCGEI